MNMKHEIKRAYDGVHAPRELTERMKRELYQKDLYELEEEITCEAARPAKPHGVRYAFYIAATLMLCTGLGLSVWGLRDRHTNYNPGTNVQVPVTAATEPTDPLQPAT